MNSKKLILGLVFLSLASLTVCQFIKTSVWGQTNNGPQASSQSLTIQQNNLLDIDLSAFDEDQDELSFGISQNPQGGNLSLLADYPSQTGLDKARVTYIPALSFTGEDSFSFQVNDGRGGFDEAVIEIKVEPANQECSPEKASWIQWWEIAYEPPGSFYGNWGDYHDPIVFGNDTIYAAYLEKSDTFPDTRLLMSSWPLDGLTQKTETVVDEQIRSEAHHTPPSIMVDKDGYIHAVYMDKSPNEEKEWDYKISNASSTIEQGFHDADDVFPKDAPVDYIHYPRFAKDLETGDIYLVWGGNRDDKNMYFGRYDYLQKKYEIVTITKDPEYLAAKMAVAAGPGGVIHLAWMWNHAGGVGWDLSYAYSPDKGENWYKADGSAYNLPITKSQTENESALLPPELQNPYTFRCQVHLVVDSFNRPHIFFYASQGQNPEMRHEFDVYHLTYDQRQNWKKPYIFAHGGEQDPRDGQWLDVAIDSNDVITVLARNMDVFKTRDYGNTWKYYNLPSQPFKPDSYFMVGRVRLDQVYTREKNGLLFYLDDEGVDGREIVGVTCGEKSQPSLPGDLNNDNQVNILDLVIVGGSFGKKQGEAGYDSRADANNSGGAIDIFDLVVVGNNFS